MTQKTPLSEFLPYQLSITSNAVSGRIALEYRQRFGLSVPEWRVMAVLGDAGPLTQRDLTRLTADPKFVGIRVTADEVRVVLYDPYWNNCGQRNFVDMTKPEEDPDAPSDDKTIES